MTNVTTGDKSVDSVGPELGRVRAALDSSSTIDLSRSSLSAELHKAASWQDCVDLLESPSHGLLHIATSVVLQRMNDVEFGNNLSSYITSQRPGVVPLLRILGSSKRGIPPSIIEAIVAATKDSSNLTQEAGSRAIAFRAPEHIPELLTRLTPAIAHGLSYSGDQKLLEPILQFWQAQQSDGSRYPPSLGFLVTPEWLAKNAYSHTHLVGALALAFGYIDERWFAVGQEIPRWVVDAWRIGINYVTQDLEKVPIEELQTLQSFSMRQMLPWTSGMYAAPASSEFPSEIVRAGFISAVRSFERENLAEKRNESPYHPKKRHNIEWARFCHAPASRCRSSLISNPLEEAKKKGIPAQYWDAYLKEHAVILLELDRETQREAELFFKARWQLMSEHGVAPGPIRDFPVNEENSASFPHLARLVLPKLPSSRGLNKSPLSLGARAAALLFEYCDASPSQQLLLDLEQHHKSSLRSIGCEIQVPFSTDRESQTLPWKVALRMLGIPSPYRPEYHKLVEGSFAPSWSYLVPIGTILSLSRIGLFRENQAIALHISIGAELGDNVRYLLFPQQFITTLHRGKYTPQLMSKGFACTHKDGYSPHQEGMSSSYLGIKPAGEGTTRTEIRSFRIPGETLHSPSGEESFVEDITCTHLLASAAASDNSALRAVWEAYCREIEGYVETLPSVVQRMFRVNWYEGTGEPYDRSVMQLLPSYRQVTEAVEWAVSSDTFDSLKTEFSQMRRKYALQLQDLVGLPSSLQQDPRSFITRNGFTILRPIGGDVTV